MITSRRKPRKLRCLITLTLFVLGLSAVFGVFSAEADDKVFDKTNDLRPVYVLSGDTLWSLVEEYYDYEGDIRKAVYEVEQINNIDNGMICAGEIIYIPNK